MTSLEERVQLLEDEREILHVLSVYGQAIDYGHEELFADLWTDTAVLTYNFEVANTRTGTGLTDVQFEGKQAIVDFFRAHTHAPNQYHKHLLMDPHVELDGDRATAQSYYVRLDEQLVGPQMSSFGRYLDTFVRCPDGRWRLQSRRGEAENRVAGQKLYQPSGASQ